MSPLNTALAEIAKSEEATCSFELKSRIIEEGYATVDRHGWMQLTKKGLRQLELARAADRAAKDRRNQRNRVRNSIAKSLGLTKTAYGWE
jgi:hypothetical protein